MFFRQAGCLQLCTTRSWTVHNHHFIQTFSVVMGLDGVLQDPALSQFNPVRSYARLTFLASGIFLCVSRNVGVFVFSVCATGPVHLIQLGIVHSAFGKAPNFCGIRKTIFICNFPLILRHILGSVDFPAVLHIIFIVFLSLYFLLSSSFLPYSDFILTFFMLSFSFPIFTFHHLSKQATTWVYIFFLCSHTLSNIHYSKNAGQRRTQTNNNMGRICSGSSPSLFMSTNGTSYCR
jgi:hypothetical protein